MDYLIALLASQLVRMMKPTAAVNLKAVWLKGHPKIIDPLHQHHHIFGSWLSQKRRITRQFPCQGKINIYPGDSGVYFLLYLGVHHS